MPEAVTTLREPFKLPNGTLLPNRLTKAALSECLAGEDFSPGDRIKQLYRRWSTSGAGMTITGNVMIDRRAIGEPGNVVIEDERHLADIVEWADIVKSHGSVALVQINHPGRQVMRTLSAHPVAPSPIVTPGMAGTFAVPRELTHDEILDIIARWARTAGIVTRAGFDGVQIHGAHGYLVSQFLSPLANQRTDQWGGSPENRRRFLLELVSAVRAEIGDAVLAVKLNSADFQRGGFDQDESLEVVRALAAAGIDLLEISGGTYSSAAMIGVAKEVKESTRQREAYFLDYAVRVRAELPDLPLMLTGGFRSAEAMADAINSGAVDIIGLARPLAAYPDLPAGLLDGGVTATELRVPRTGLRLIDSVSGLAHYTVQMWRMADGLEPAPRRHPALTTARYIARTGIDGARLPKRG
ncbi:MAG TPA: NADH:flavin oxidoreductase/NADH oxidase family protein [Aeromicrobium sp.]|nr:NADH:flavin oxidoreductase/NADH oxidase family protein [Aeromicrobium sp.]